MEGDNGSRKLYDLNCHCRRDFAGIVNYDRLEDVSSLAKIGLEYLFLFTFVFFRVHIMTLQKICLMIKAEVLLLYTRYYCTFISLIIFQVCQLFLNISEYFSVRNIACFFFFFNVLHALPLYLYIPNIASKKSVLILSMPLPLHFGIV